MVTSQILKDGQSDTSVSSLPEQQQDTATITTQRLQLMVSDVIGDWRHRNDMCAQ
jgi:hypothetical protein